MKYLMGLDLGTTSIAAVAVGLDGRLLGEFQLPNDSQRPGLPQGHAEQDPQRIWEITLQVLRGILQQNLGEPLVLGITGQMHGMLGVNAERVPVTPLITWQDRRANERMSGRTDTYLEQALSSCTPAMFISTGVKLAAGFVGSTLFVLKQQSQWPAQMRWALILADWIATQLTGEPPVSDRGNAASTGLFDQQHDRWSKELLHALDLPAEIFPPVQESGVEIGRVTASVAALTGLPTGLPVCNAIGDNQAAVLGSFPVGEPAIHVNIGTGGQISWPIPRFQRVEGTETRYLPRQRYMLVGAGLAGGDAYAWMQRTVSQWLGACGMSLPSEAIYERMNRLAEAVPDHVDGLKIRPVFRGTRSRPLDRGSFTGVTNDNFSIGHVSRAIMQGIADGMFEFLELAGPLAPRNVQRIIGAGNGLRNNRLLTEIFSRRFTAPVWFASHPQEAAYGAAMLAGVEIGNWSSLEEAGKWIRLEPASHRE